MLNSIILYRMLFKLRKPFRKWDAYKLGIIDRYGNKIYHGRLTPKQRKAWTKYDIFIRNLKRLIAKVPGGKTKFGTYAAIMALLKEDVNKVYNLSEESQEELFNFYYKKVIDEMSSGVVSGGEPTTTTQAIPDKIKIDNRKKHQKKREDFITYLKRLQQYK